MARLSFLVDDLSTGYIELGNAHLKCNKVALWPFAEDWDTFEEIYVSFIFFGLILLEAHAEILSTHAEHFYAIGKRFCRHNISLVLNKSSQFDGFTREHFTN